MLAYIPMQGLCLLHIGQVPILHLSLMRLWFAEILSSVSTCVAGASIVFYGILSQCVCVGVGSDFTVNERNIKVETSFRL